MLAPTISTDGTTTFQDNAKVDIASVTQTDSTNKVSSLKPFDQNSIKDFLAKPVQISAPTYTTTTTAGTVLYQTDVMKPLTTYKLWANKLWGYQYIRATAVFRVQVAAEPFQAGLMRLAFLPSPALHEVPGSSSNAYKSAHTFSIMQFSVLPGVDLDVHDTAAELRIPFVTPYSYTDLPNLYSSPLSGDYMSSPGRFYLMAYCPSLGINTTIPIKVYLHYEDVELAAPNYTGESRKPMGSVFKGEMENQQIISSTLSKFASKINYFTSAPSISSLAEGASQIAKAFGYSKPQTMTPVTPLIIQSLANAGNSDGTMPCDVLGLNPGTMLPPVSGLMGSDQDEMSFAYIKSIPAYYNGISWSNATGAGTELYSLANSPPNYYTQWSSGVNSGFSQPPFGYITDCFQLWRGSIEVTLKFVKSPLAIGTLALEFYPDDTSTTGLNNSNYVLREIIDLRNQNSITLSLPWARNTYWTKNSSFNGRFVLRVINPLVLASTAGTSISIMMFVNAGPDYEVAVPFRDVNRVPYAGESDSSALPMINKVIGSGSELPTDPVANMNSIGDPFTSIKQLLMCSTRSIIPTVAANTTRLFGDMGANAYMYTNGSTLITTPGNGFMGDWLSVLSCGFAFQRGSLRLICSATGNSSTLVKGFLVAQTSTPALSKVAPTVDPSLSGTSFGISGATINPNLNTCLSVYRNGPSVGDFRIPNYRMTPFGPAKYYASSENWVMPVGAADKNNASPSLATYIFTTATITDVFRSAGDDFTLGYFIGFPPIVISST